MHCPLCLRSDDEPDGDILLDGTTLALASEQVGKEHCFGIYHPIRDTVWQASPGTQTQHTSLVVLHELVS